MTFELKPCPFCGGEAVWRSVKGGQAQNFEDQFRVTCGAGYCAETPYGDVRSEQAAWWNRRSSSEAQSLTAQNAALVEEVGRLRAALIEERAHAIYNGWSFQPDWVTWVAGGNGHKQNEARALASQALNGEPK